MLVVMNSHATPEQIEHVVEAIRGMTLTPHPMPGATRTAIGITGNISAVDPRTLEGLPGVLELIRVTKPYKLASREMHEADTYVRLPQTVIGPGTFTLIAGPCSVENEDMVARTADFLMGHGVRLLPFWLGGLPPGLDPRIWRTARVDPNAIAAMAEAARSVPSPSWPGLSKPSTPHRRSTDGPPLSSWSGLSGPSPWARAATDGPDKPGHDDGATALGRHCEENRYYTGPAP